MIATTYSGLSDRGRVRAANEDRWFADPGQQLYLVADGLGGHLGGETAAQAVVDVLPQRLGKIQGLAESLDDPATIQQVSDVVRELSWQMAEEARNEPGLSGMGATLVAALLRADRALILHLGDSRAYLMRDGRLRQLTKDHTLVQLLLDGGVISSKQASGHPARNQLSRYVGMSGDVVPEARVVELAANDRLLLCTDGLTNMLDDRSIESILTEEPEPASACRRMVDAANKAGGKDNITVLLVTVQGKNG